MATGSRARHSAESIVSTRPGYHFHVILHGGPFTPQRLASLADEIQRFHGTLEALRDDFANPALEARISDEQFLQGPLSDAMAHAGQLAMLRAWRARR